MAVEGIKKNDKENKQKEKQHVFSKFFFPAVAAHSNKFTKKDVASSTSV